MDIWQELTYFIEDKNRLLIITHLNPDGDAIGSQMALAHFLRQRDKVVHLFNADPTPKYFKFLDPLNEILEFSEQSQHHRQMIGDVDGVIAVDASEWGRFGRLGTFIANLNLPLACIDHHLQTETIGQVRIIDEKASSTGELIYEYLTRQECRWTQEIVDALYTCVMTDTGSFRYSNTNVRAHQIAADLLQKGARFQTIFEKIYENYSKARMILMGRLLAEMRFACQDRLVYLVLSQAMLKETGAELWETEGFSELPRNMSHVEVSILFTEVNERLTKASIRSKGKISIHELASKLGGGGHRFAAGVTLPLPLEQTIDKVMREAEKLFIGQSTTVVEHAE